MASPRVFEPHLSRKGGKACIYIYIYPQSAGSIWAGCGLCIQAASTCVLAVQLILPSKLQFVQISDHGELCPGYREGTDYALEVGKVSTSAVT